MQHVALLGAGFSRNWGGWLATEVLGEILGRVADDPEVYGKLRHNKNFEDTLAELQADDRTCGTVKSRERLEHFESCVLSTFAEMNQSFAELAGWGLSNDKRESIDAFLARFDVIFTLNQDLLLELHYRNELETPRRWSGINFPGMGPPANWYSFRPEERLTPTWQPQGDVKIDDNVQPVIKLHGSVNWRDPEGNQLLVMGGGKYQTIERHPVLRRYLDIFTEVLGTGQTKLMAIGYGFNDSHINDILVSAGTQHGLQMHLVNPSGLEVLSRYPAGAIQGPNPLNNIPLSGVTIRSLREIFSGDKLSQRSLMRFFE